MSIDTKTITGTTAHSTPAAAPAGATHAHNTSKSERDGIELPKDKLHAAGGVADGAFKQALDGAEPASHGHGDVAGAIRNFLKKSGGAGSACKDGGTQVADASGQIGGGAAPQRVGHRNGGGRRGSGRRGGAGHRAGQAAGARARRQGQVRGSKVARTGQRGSGVKGNDFNALTQKLQKMGISKQDIQDLSKKYNVPERMILGVMMQESRGNPIITSPAGAKGLMQLMPGTARQLGVKNVLDPKQNLEGGTKYLGQMLKMFGGNESKALAAYNAGPGRVKKAGGVPHIRETQNYVRIISGNMNAAQTAFDAWK